MKMAMLAAAWVFSVNAGFGLASQQVHAQMPYYQGKTIRLVQGRNPGGSGDTRVKLVAPYLKKYIPGNPTVISEYMDGGEKRKGSGKEKGQA